METPQSANHAPRAHVPSAKLSSRKKALFGKEGSDQSDLDSITPLRFRHSRKPPANDVLENITSFRNLFGNESPESDRSLSPDFAQKYSNNGRYELLTEEYDKENCQEVDEETRFSFHSIPETPSGRLSAEESALLDESNSNSLSLQMSSDLHLIEKHSRHVQRTPGAVTQHASFRPFQNRSLEPSFRKTHHYPNSKMSATPDSNKPVNGKYSIDARANVKARTALHFNDIKTISTKSFYSSSSVETPAKVVPKPFVVSTPPAQPVKEISPTTKPTTVSTGKTPRKPMRKRSKSFSSATPRLGQRGDVHKIRKPSKKQANNSNDAIEAKSSKKHAKQNSKKPKTENRAKTGGTKSCPTTPKTLDTKCTEQEEITHQLKRVKKILQNCENNMPRARPLSAARSMTDLSKMGKLSSGEETGSSSSDEDDASDMEEDEKQDQNRKFFHSRSGSRSIRKVYNHFDTISLAVRKGGKRKLIGFPQKPKRRRTDFLNDEFNFESEKREVDDLISRLDHDNSEVVVEYYEAYEPPTPHEEATHLDDDEPIPIQSNIIYLTANELGTQKDHVMYDDSMHNGGIVIDQQDANNQLITHDGNDLQSAMLMDIATEDLAQCTQPLPAIQADDTIQATSVAIEAPTEYYPIFYRDRVKELWIQERAQSNGPAHRDIFHLLRQQDRSARHRHGTGQDQYQLDAGQRAYGAVHCAECGLTYSNNEPEEELIHDNFHRSLGKLTFAGWANEHVVGQVPEWDVTGRIIVVSQVDSKQWLAKVQSILEVVDNELGFATHGEFPEGAVFYMAIARSTVLGLCVVQPLQYANRMISIEGLHGVPIDCYSSEFYPARCGISRIWVSPKFRRLGVGRKLVAAIKKHYIFGYVMKLDEIAFGAPTESGKLFAESITGRKDFLVYL